MADVDIVMEDSMDGGPPSVGSGDMPAVLGNVNPMTPSGTTTTTTTSTTKKVKVNLKLILSLFVCDSCYMTPFHCSLCVVQGVFVCSKHD